MKKKTEGGTHSNFKMKAEMYTYLASVINLWTRYSDSSLSIKPFIQKLILPPNYINE